MSLNYHNFMFDASPIDFILKELLTGNPDRRIFLKGTAITAIIL